jgi:hypothetical protein
MLNSFSILLSISSPNRETSSMVSAAENNAKSDNASYAAVRALPSLVGLR